MNFDWKAALVDLLVYVVTKILPTVLAAGGGVAAYHACHTPTVKVVAPADCNCPK